MSDKTTSASPRVGELAPDFTLPDDTGTTRSLSAQRGHWLVLYFYPKDDTPGLHHRVVRVPRRLRRRTRRTRRRDLGHQRPGQRQQGRVQGQVRAAVHAHRRRGPPGRGALRRLGRQAELRQDLHGHRARHVPHRPRRAASRKVWPKVKPEGHADEVLAALREAKAPRERRPHARPSESRHRSWGETSDASRRRYYTNRRWQRLPIARHEPRSRASPTPRRAPRRPPGAPDGHRRPPRRRRLRAGRHDRGLDSRRARWRTSCAAPAATPARTTPAPTRWSWRARARRSSGPRPRTSATRTVTFLHRPDGALANDLALREQLVRLIRTLQARRGRSPSTPPSLIHADGYIQHTDHREAAMAALDAVYPAARNAMAFPHLVIHEGLEPHAVRRMYLFWTDKAQRLGGRRPTRSTSRSRRSASTPARCAKPEALEERIRPGPPRRAPAIGVAAAESRSGSSTSADRAGRQSGRRAGSHGIRPGRLSAAGRRVPRGQRAGAAPGPTRPTARPARGARGPRAGDHLVQRRGRAPCCRQVVDGRHAGRSPAGRAARPRAWAVAASARMS